MRHLALGEQRVFWRNVEEPRCKVQHEYQQGVKACEGVIEVDEGGDEDDQLQEKRTQVVKSHGEKIFLSGGVPGKGCS